MLDDIEKNCSFSGQLELCFNIDLLQADVH